MTERAVRAGLLIAGLLTVAGLCEVGLRTLPLRGIDFASSSIDPELGPIFRPGSMVWRWNNEGRRIVRRVNSVGFLDHDVPMAKLAGVFRAGFFGDSFVQAMQVPLEQTFFRIVERQLKTERVETIAFGRAGHGTVHAYLKSRRFAEQFSLDLVVYVFYDNDLGDQLYDVKRMGGRAYATMVDGEPVIDHSRVDEWIESRRRVAPAKWLYDRSVLAQTVYRRGRLLLQTYSRPPAAPDGTTRRSPELTWVGTPPSQWPPDLHQRAMRTAAAFILRWRGEVEQSGAHFAILYIPLEAELGDAESSRDSWRAWLATFCSDRGIELLDPFNVFSDAVRGGVRIYEGHLSREGHVVLGGHVAAWLRKKVVRGG